MPPGRAAGLARIATEREAAALVRESRALGLKLLPQAARSSLTGGAAPRGELIVSVEKLAEAGPLARHAGGARQTVGAGLRLCELQRELAKQGLYYPPVPTFDQAMVGGTVSTNAGGPATFKYGTTRDWVRGLRVLLFNGDLLELERGQAVARRGQFFRLVLSDGQQLEVPTPSYVLPRLKKIAAGYHAADALDLLDLFVGAEGTLGLITAVTLDLAALPAAVVTAITFARAEQLLALAAAVREAATRARTLRDGRGPDVRAIEWIDQHGLEILKGHGDDRRARMHLPQQAEGALLLELELEQPVSELQLQELLAGFFEGRGDLPDGPLSRLLHLLREHRALDGLELALPQDEARQRALRELREAVPRRVNELLAASRREDPRVQKVGGDLIVPCERLAEMIEACDRSFSSRDLPCASWGHLSDGNLHPNVLPRNYSEVQAGCSALLELADEAMRLGGCPLSEHGVGRNPIKQEMLRRFLGDAAVGEMRRIKRALDPDGRFAPGVLFAP